MVTEPAATPTPASFGRRLAAFSLDALILLVVGWILLVLTTWLVGPSASVRLDDPAAASVDVAAARATFNAGLLGAVSALYFVGAWRTSGSTLGQRSLGVRVAPITSTPDVRGTLPVGRALWRWALLGGPIGIASAVALDAPLLFLLISGAGAIWIITIVASTARSGRGVHDRLSGSIVVRAGR